ncbi:hypothetical protein PPERSA_08201 [Pseudocohnilembus persalinus]|uniref:Autophagy protein 5 n=1 Tax=Pseudocohnilembus persalinus TaxID=266149 RepID=A0A0V0QFZ6_PSEPJ|nr:hypothetical protein PPERSA_08201 [Pseudocohnilembus persalinus]|eukprot:KRX01100.1 hypothetical protein PPERSA_08201 [Pseudocohnilembus persalinus]
MENLENRTSDVTQAQSKGLEVPEVQIRTLSQNNSPVQQQQGEQNLIVTELLDSKIKNFKIKEMLFQTAIPVLIVMNQKDVADDNCGPFPLLMNFHRIHYIYQYYNDIEKFFENYIPYPLGIQDMWLEWEGKFLHWNMIVQIGVAFDLIILKNFQKKNSNEYSQPIQLQLNFRNKPTNLHSQFDFNPKNEALFYTQNLKESLTIKFGDRGIGYLVRDIENKKRQNMYEFFCSAKSKEFYRIFDLCLWQKKNVDRKPEEIKVPIRIYIQGQDGRLQISENIFLNDNKNDDEEKNTSNDNINHEKNQLLENQQEKSNISDEGQQKQDKNIKNLKLLGNTLGELFPDIIDVEQEFEFDFNDQNFEQNDKKNQKSIKQNFEIDQNFQKFTVICNGIILSLKTPIQYLAENLYNADGFVYLVIRY